MTRLWPAGDPVTVKIDGGGLPQSFWWRGVWHPVVTVANRWRVQASWWIPSAEASREYFKLVTADGLLCVLYRDMLNDAWFCARLYD